MNNKFPIYLAKIEILLDGRREFVKDSNPYTEIIWGTGYNRFFFKLRKAYFTKSNCNFNCPPKEFFCCKKIGCIKRYGYFEWEEISFFLEEEREKILSLWDNGTGFLREEGCILPRELRSLVCLLYVCSYSKKHDSKIKE